MQRKTLPKGKIKNKKGQFNYYVTSLSTKRLHIYGIKWITNPTKKNKSSTKTKIKIKIKKQPGLMSHTDLPLAP